MTVENVEESALIEQLRERMKGQMTSHMFADDDVFRRFLRARNHDLNAAETMLRNHVIWRHRNRVDTILDDYTPPEVLTKYITLNRIGFDSEGCPVLYSHVGGLDTRGILKSSRRSDVSFYIIKFLEQNLKEMKELSEKLGKPVEKWSYIINYDQFSISVATHKPTLEVLMGLLMLYDHNYPERLKNAYLINAPFAFTVCWPLFKPLISGRTVQKMHIYGREGWQEEIFKHIDASAIPAFLGGELTDPDGDPMCRTIIKRGGVVPESYHSVDKRVSTILGATRLVVGRMAKAHVTVEVDIPGSTIEWEFDVVCRDVAFSVLSATGEEVVSRQRVRADLSAEAGMYLCGKAGTYILEFDNSYSWMHSKEIHYNVHVTEPAHVKDILPS